LIAWQERGELQTEAQTIQDEQAALQLIEDAVYGRSLIVTKALLHSTKKVRLETGGIDSTAALGFTMQRSSSACNQDLKDGGIVGLLDTVILPSLRHEDVAIRKHAVQCLGLYCLLDEVPASGPNHLWRPSARAFIQLTPAPALALGYCQDLSHSSPPSHPQRR
jgi:hypothetical protein